ncbi:MAG: PTS sugar transporter subunit IIA [Parvibaculaceae bacterium]
MKLIDLLQAEAIALDIPAADKTGVFDAAAQRLGVITGREASVIRAALTARERMGPTTIHKGIAIPHARLDGLDAPAAIFLRLARAVDFDAPDGHPVDLVFAALWPADAHGYSLIGLAELCRLLREPSLAYWLRAAETPREALMLVSLAAGLATSRHARKHERLRRLQRVPS